MNHMIKLDLTVEHPLGRIIIPGFRDRHMARREESSLEQC